MYLTHPNCGSVVQVAWKVDVRGTDSFRLVKKDKDTKKRYMLGSWNKTDFGQVEEWISQVRRNLKKFKQLTLYGRC